MDYHPITPAGQRDRREIERLAAAVGRLARPSGEVQALARLTAAGLSLRQPPRERVWAKLTGLTGYEYSWAESNYLTSGSTHVTDGRTGGPGSWPAYEVNRVVVRLPAYADLYRATPGEYYLFEKCCPLSGNQPPRCEVPCPGVDMPFTIYESGYPWFHVEWDVPPCSALPPDPFPLTYDPAFGSWRGCWADPCGLVLGSCFDKLSDAWVIQELSCGNSANQMIWRQIALSVGSAPHDTGFLTVTLSSCLPLLGTTTISGGGTVTFSA